jgi:predicted amidophosphoribosyltransferase
VIRGGLYEGALRKMCLSAKRPRGEELAAALGALLWDAQQEAFAKSSADLVVPVPHHWSECLGRWRPAPVMLADVLARRLRVDLGTSILAKVRRTRRQSSLPSSRRRANVRGAFRVPRRRRRDLEGRRVLLVDDVLTTGATADEASRMLLENGAASVVASVVARRLARTPEPPLSG